MGRYTTLFFDADDTLLDFHKSEQEALRKVFLLHKIPFDDEVNERYQRINGKLWRDFEQGLISKQNITDTRFSALFAEMGIQEDGKAFNREYLELLGGESHLIDGALRLCEDLSRTHTLYCVTNGVAKTQHRRLEGSGLDKIFKGIFVSEEIGWQKPKKEYFDEVFRRIGKVELSRCLIIGDSLTSDIRGGNNIGMDTCWYNPKGKPLTGTAKPTYIIENLNRLPELLAAEE